MCERAVVPAAAESLIDWTAVIEIAHALVTRGVAHSQLAAIVTQLVAAHRLLEGLGNHAEQCLLGSASARQRLRDEFCALAHQYPGLRRFGQTLISSVEKDHKLPGCRVAESKRTVSFDGVVRIASAVALAVPVTEANEFHQAVDTVIGLVGDALMLDRLFNALRAHGADGMIKSLHELQRLRRVSVEFALPTMRSLSLPGLPPGLPGIPDGSRDLLGGLFNLDPRAPLDLAPSLTATSDVIAELLARAREPMRPGLEPADARPPWWDLLGVGPPELIPQDEIRRIRCLVDMKRALRLREQPPPPRPPQVVWSDSITHIQVGGRCGGDEVVLHGSFGPYSGDRGVALPMVDGCRAFPVPASAWTSTTISITLPLAISSGPVGLVDLAYVRLYDEWVAYINQLTKRILDDAECARAEAPQVSYLAPFAECAPATPQNYLRAGAPVIRSFSANGHLQFAVEPGQHFQLRWDLVNVEEFSISSLSPDAPSFGGQPQILNPPGNSIDVGPFIGSQNINAAYELRAKGPCGEAIAQVLVLLRKVPVLQIRGIEQTQAIQTFDEPGTPSNSVPIVAGKQTIVRVYVSADNLGSFINDAGLGEVRVSGELRFMTGTGKSIAPLATAIARTHVLIDRHNTEHTLNFRIPAEFATGTRGIRINVWTETPIPFPQSADVNSFTWTLHTISWIQKTPFKVRFVRVSSMFGSEMGEPSALRLMQKAFDLLPTPATDVLPARIATWHTSADVSTMDGIGELLGHLEDQHDCTIFEALFPWGDECPDDDDEVWVGLVNGAGGRASFGWLGDRNTAVASSLDRVNVAHELGHTLSLNHVNPAAIPAYTPPGSHDTLPNDGAIRPGDAFDPSEGKTLQVLGTGYLGLWDFMSYAQQDHRWVTRYNWERMLSKF